MKHLFLIILTALAVTLTAAERVIVENGKSDYVIVYNTTTGVPLRAAQDLQQYIHKAVGVKLPLIKNAQRKNRPAFMVGFDQVTAPEAFIVKTVGRDIHISGNDTLGNVENALSVAQMKEIFMNVPSDTRLFLPRAETGAF